MRVELERDRRDAGAAQRRATGALADQPAPARAGARRGARCRRCASASITGPTSVASSAGSPTLSSRQRAAQHLDHAVGDALVHAQQAQRRAALAGRAEGALHDRVDHLLGQRGAVDDHRVDAAGLGDQRHDRAVLRGQRAVDEPARPAVEPVKQTPAVRASATSAAPTVSPGPCSSASASARHAGRVQQRDEALRATAGVCSAGLAATALPATSAATTWPAKIASGKFHGLMQTNTPRPCRCSSLLSPVGPGSVLRLQALPRPGRRSSGRSRPPRALRRRSRRASCAPPCTSRPQNSGRRASSASAARRSTAARCGERRGVPGRRSRRAGAPSRRRRRRGVGFGDRLDTRSRRARASSGARSARQARSTPRRVARPLRPSQPYSATGSGRPRRRGAARSGEASSVSTGTAVVGQLVHERRVGAVLQQPPHQVGQQVAVLAHRRVDAHAASLASLQHLAVHALAHAVQALHLEARAARARHLHDRGDGAGVVGRELRVDHVGVADQRAGAGQVGDVGVVLVREHRVAGQAQLLRALDLAVPVGALHQPHHEAQAVRARDARHLVDDRRARASGRPAPPGRSRATAGTRAAMRAASASSTSSDSSRRSLSSASIVRLMSARAAGSTSCHTRGSSSANTRSRCASS